MTAIKSVNLHKIDKMDTLTFSFATTFLSLFLLACHSYSEPQNTAATSANNTNINYISNNSGDVNCLEADLTLADFEKVDIPKRLMAIEDQTSANLLEVKNRKEHQVGRIDSLKWSKEADKVIQKNGISAVQRQIANISFPKLLTYFLKNLR